MLLLLFFSRHQISHGSDGQHVQNAHEADNYVNNIF